MADNSKRKEYFDAKRRHKEFQALRRKLGYQKSLQVSVLCGYYREYKEIVVPYSSRLSVREYQIYLKVIRKRRR